MATAKKNLRQTLDEQKERERNTTTLPAQGTTAMHTDANTNPDTTHDNLLQPVANIRDIQDELSSGEWVKKPDLAELGAFNLVGVAERQNTYKGKTTQQWVFEVQLLDGENKGARMLVSMDRNIARDKFAKAVMKHGGVGPVWLKFLEAESADKNDAYIFVLSREDYDAPRADKPPF